MTPSFKAFSDELLRIKMAQMKLAEPDDLGPQQPQPTEAQPRTDEQQKRPNNAAMFKELGKNMLRYGIPFGVGTGAAYVLAEKLAPMNKPKPGWLPYMPFAIGGASALGTYAYNRAMATARKLEDDAAKQ